MALDLWTPKFAEDRLHPNFRVASRIASPETINVINRWSDGFPDRDGKFVDEFQLTFDSAFWELYLNAAFRELGYSCVFDHPSPDFELHLGDSVVIAEAVVASHAGGYRPEWDKLGVVRSGHLDIHQAVRYTATRISNAICSKASKYISSYCHMQHVQSRPFVVCVAPFDFPFSFDWSQASLRQVLFGTDVPMVDVRSDNMKVIMGVSESSMITKDSGTDIPIGLFRNDRLSHVSAVLFSSLATFSKARALSHGPEENSFFRSERYDAFGSDPIVQVAQKPTYAESLLDGLILCVNPYATCPLDADPFVGKEITIEAWDRENEEYTCDAPHMCLLRRAVFTIRPTDLPRGTEWSNQTREDYREFGRPRWPDREFRPIAGHVGVGLNNHLAHVGEWTAVVFQDAVDGTWHAMAVKQYVYSLPEFRSANSEDHVPTIMRLDDHESMEEAISDICRAIETYSGDADND